MKLNSRSVKVRSAQRTSGMTLIEVLVGCGVGVMVMLVVGVIFVSSLRSFADMGNYMIMDQASRNALDKMTRDIRKAQNLSAFANNGLAFTYNGSTNLYYTYNAASGTLTQFKTGGTTNLLLTNCKPLPFTISTTLPSPSATNATPTIP